MWRFILAFFAGALVATVVAMQWRGASAIESPFKPMANVKQVMITTTIPASDLIFGAAADTPTTDAAWQGVQNSALALAESGNLLMIPDRAVDNQEWVRQSQAMIDAAMTAFNAAAARNADQLSNAGDAIYGTCDSCHNKYIEKKASSNP